MEASELIKFMDRILKALFDLLESPINKALILDETVFEVLITILSQSENKRFVHMRSMLDHFVNTVRRRRRCPRAVSWAAPAPLAASCGGRRRDAEPGPLARREAAPGGARPQVFNSHLAHINLTRSCKGLILRAQDPNTGKERGQQKLVPACMKSLQYIFKLIAKSANLHYTGPHAAPGLEDFQGSLRELFQARSARSSNDQLTAGARTNDAVGKEPQTNASLRRCRPSTSS